MKESRARFDHWIWKFISPILDDLNRFAWRQEHTTDAKSMQYKRIHKTRAADGYYHVKDGMMRLWMSIEEYERISDKGKNKEVA